MEATLGVTGQQRFLLRFVGLVPGITSERLTQLVSRPHGDLQADLDRLLSRNLLARPHGSEGLFLTGQGAAVNGVMTGTVEQAVAKVLDDATPIERISFRRMLERVVEQLLSRR